MNKVQVAYVHQNFVSHSFHHSMMRLTARGHQLMPNNMAARGNSMSLVEARNELMRLFLDTTDATHIFMIDTDMGFPSNIVTKLLEPNLSVVGALCYGQGEIEPDDLGGYKTKPFITAYDLVKQDDGFTHYTFKEDIDVESGQPAQVAATGTGALLVAREAALAVRTAYDDVWFDQVAYPGTNPVMRLSEDLSFCYRLSTVGVPIFIHTGVKTSHLKNVWLS